MTKHKSDSTAQIKLTLAKRYRKEKLFRWSGVLAVGIGFFLLVALLTDIVVKAVPAFHQHWIKVDVQYTPQWLGVEASQTADLENANYRKVFKKSLYAQFPEVKKRKQKRLLGKLFSNDAEFEVKGALLQQPIKLGKTIPVWLMADDDVDLYLKDIDQLGEVSERIDAFEAQVIKQLYQQGRIENRFNWQFFKGSDSREPELAGVKGAFKGTILTLLVTLLISFPIAVATAIYLEEFAPKNKWTDFIEVNINNLAAVPSIVFGLLGLAVIINLLGLPRSTPLVGGVVLSLMTLPTIIIASRASIKAVPPSIREAALGIGASHMQTAFGHVLPMAMPGIITGTIIGMAQALGETAPLLMIGMVAFIVDIPNKITDAATVLPVQIYLWADSPERAFIAKTSAAILVLLLVLFCMNFLAAYLRKKLERKW
ncbi:MAG: phosphate ABC transporter permease PstA [bacterium]